MSDRSLLASRRFAPVFWTQGFSVLADHLLRNTAIFAIVFELSAHDARAASDYSSLALAAYSAPYMLFSSLAGELVDRYEKRCLAQLIMIADVAIMVVAAVALAAGAVALLLAVLFAAGVRSTLFGPLKYAILPQHLEQGELIRAAGLIQASNVLAIVGGQLAGGLLPIEPAAVALVVLALAAFAASRLIGRGPPEQPPVTIDPNIVRGTWRIVGATLRDPALRRAVAGLSWFFALGSVLSSQFAAFARNELGMERGGATGLLLAYSAGIVAGSLAIGRFSPAMLARAPTPALVVQGVLLLDLGLATLAGEPVAWRVGADAFGLAAASAVYAVPLQTVLQTAGPPERRGRDLASNNIVNALAALAALGVASIPIGAGAPIAAVIAGLGLAALGFALAEWRRDRRLRAIHPIG